MAHVKTRMTRSILASVASAACLAALAGSAAGQAKPEDGTFGIDGEASQFLQDGSILAPGPKAPIQTRFMQAQSGRRWEHWTNTTYMGKQCYKIRIVPSSGPINDRSEQKLFDSWDIGPYSKDPGTYYFTLAFYAETPPPSTEKKSVIISQIWQDPRKNPILYVSLAGGYVSVQARGDAIKDGGLYNVWTDLLKPGGKGRSMPLVPRRWYRFMFRVTPSRGLLSLGRAMVWLMDNETGEWRFKGDFKNVPIGWTTIFNEKTESRTPAQLLDAFWKGKLPLANKNNLTWKVGSYRESMNATTRVYLDNVRFTTDNWNAITQGRTIGYHRAIVHLGFDERSGTQAVDRSAESNGGWGYNNHGTIVGPLRQISAGVRNNCLYFDGRDDYVRVGISGSRHEFDTGNYLSLSTWVKTPYSQVGKGLITIDEYSTTYKAKLYWVSDDTVEFAVRHPDNTLSYVRGKVSGLLRDNRWHHIAGTYNRWAKDGNRLEIYVDGKLRGTSTGADKPIWAGSKYLYVGKFSGDYFKGSIDEPMMFNYELSPAQVRSLASWYVNGELRSFGTGCVGSNGTVLQRAAGSPETGKTVYYRMYRGRRSGLAIFSLGFSATRWGPFALPLRLDFLGATGCSLYTEPALLVPVGLDSSGYASLPLTLRKEARYAGTRHFTQFMSLDPSANSWGITYTNGIETLVGGSR